MPSFLLLLGWVQFTRTPPYQTGDRWRDITPAGHFEEGETQNYKLLVLRAVS